MGASHSIPCYLRYLCWNNLEYNLEDLQRQIEILRAMSDDLLRMVAIEEHRDLQTLSQVSRWISKVQMVEPEAIRLLDESISVIERLSMYGYCSLISASTYRYSKKVDEMLGKVETLRWEGLFEVVIEKARVEKRPTRQLSTYQVKLLESTWGILMDENVGILVIFGMGGVGKTNLLANINNKLSEVGGCRFRLVIFVVAAREIESIRDEIGRRLGLRWGRETNSEKAYEIYKVLKREPFILLLDDIQRKGVDLSDIGVPRPTRENGSKVVFTTRYLEACRRMFVDAEVEVECLPPEEAWDLFQKTVGVRTLTSHPDIPALARIVAERCRGLPLALSVIGQTMSCKRTIPEWRHAIHTLISHSPKFPGVESQILPILKFSYDTLPGDKIKSCFLYCALFPEDVGIRRQDLVNYWVGEGLVSDETKGYEMISELVRASLLIEDESGYGVKMHDLVRVMALWIASDCGIQQDNFLVEREEGIRKMPEVYDWRMVKRMSVTSTQIENISGSPPCSELTTLFLQHNNNLKWISGDFFRCMESLVVLDLSHNRNLSELPEEISGLVLLRLLNLSGTSIKDLPKRFGELRELIHLDLESTSNLRSISLISGLLKLKVIKFYGSAAALDLSLLKNLERLEDLTLLTITVREVDVLKTFLGSKRLPKCTHGLYLQGLKVSGVSGNSFAATFGAFGSLRNVEMVDCVITESEMEWEDDRRRWYSPSNQTTPRYPWFMNLSTVVLLSCQHLKDLTWLVYAASLQSLSVKTSLKLKEVINKEKAGNVQVDPFRKLQVLDLGYLGELESIYWTSLSFPRLQKVSITKCPKLRKLPFHSTSVERIDDLCIEVEEGWLERVEWETEAAKMRFLPVCRTGSVSQLNPV